MKEKTISVVVGIVGGFVSSLLGGWNEAMTTLAIFMCADYITGLMVAGVFHKSMKSDTGGLSSKVGFMGLCRKIGIFIAIIIAYRLDMQADTNILKNTVIIGFMSNEAISIVENLKLMGIADTKVISKAIELLKNDKEE